MKTGEKIVDEVIDALRRHDNKEGFFKDSDYTIGWIKSTVGYQENRNTKSSGFGMD